MKKLKRIDRLTEDQKALMPTWRDEWIKIGLSTEPADRPRFEKAVRECYAYSNLDSKIPIIWVSSPMVGAFAAPLAASIICAFKKEKDSAVHSAVEYDV